MSVITDYIGACEPEQQAVLYRIRELVLEVDPDLTERIAYKMPTFTKRHNIFHFAPARTHLGIYPGSAAIEAFTKSGRLDAYDTSKGTIRLPWPRALDEDLIRDLVRWNLEQE